MGEALMSRRKQLLVATLCVATSSMSSCGNHDFGAQNTSSGEKSDGSKVLNLYIWADYMAPDTVSSFEKLTGIKVRVSYIDNVETMETRMLTGNSGVDVTDPTAAFIQRQIRSGAYLPLDKKQVPNLVNLDPVLMSQVAVNDPGNAHGVGYLWGTFGMGYNEKMVAKALPNISLNSWRLIFDPEYAAKLASCGINVIDDPVGVVRLVLIYLGKNPNAPSSQDLADVVTVLDKIRPYVRNIDTSSAIEAMANGGVCIALAYNGAIVQARKRAQEAKNGIRIDYVIPKEGSLLWFDMLAIPRDAPHAANAYLFINYILDPQVIARISNSVGYANANAASTPLLDTAIVTDTAVYPTPDQKLRLIMQMEPSPEQSRAITRIWQKFRAGQ